MSGRIVGEVLKYAPRDLSPTQRLVLVALAERAYDDDRIARGKSVVMLADETCVSRSTVMRALAELVERGLIARGKSELGRGQIQTYYLSPLVPARTRKGDAG